MRLVHLSDLHLGFRQYQRCTPSGINQREADVAGSFQRAIAQIIQLAPDLVVVGGDVFHAVRPSNPAILHAYRSFAALRDALPETAVIMVAGNHDAPRTQETGCILRLFREIGIYVADSKPEVFTFPSRDLAVLAVPDVYSIEKPPELVPPPGFRHNVLVMHAGIQGALPAYLSTPERAALEVSPAELNADRWSYVALGHYHVYQKLDARVFYSGSLDYTSSNVWGERREETAPGGRGKGFIEHNLVTNKHKFHDVNPPRLPLDLEPIDAAGLTAAEIDEAIRSVINSVRGGIDDKIIRLQVRNVHRHVVRELDHAAIRDYKRRALHFHLDPRKPDPVARRVGEGAPGRRATLPEIVAERLRERTLTPGLDRDQFVSVGMQYLGRAEEALTAAMPVVED